MVSSTIESALGEAIARHPALRVPPTGPIQRAEVLAVNIPLAEATRDIHSYIGHRWRLSQ